MSYEDVLRSLKVRNELYVQGTFTFGDAAADRLSIPEGKIDFYDAAIKIGSEGEDSRLFIRADGSISLSATQLNLTATEVITLNAASINLGTTAKINFYDTGVKIGSEGEDGKLFIEADLAVSINTTNFNITASDTLSLGGSVRLSSTSILDIGPGVMNHIEFYDSAIKIGSEAVDGHLFVRADGAISLSTARLSLTATSELTITGNGLGITGTEGITLTGKTVAIVAASTLSGNGMFDMNGSTYATGAADMRLANGGFFGVGTTAQRFQILPTAGSLFYDTDLSILFFCKTAGTWDQLLKAWGAQAAEA